MKTYELKQKETQDLKNNLARLNKKKHKLLIAQREFEALSKRWDTEKAYYIEAIEGMEKGVQHWESIVNKSGKVQCRICEQWYAGSYINRHMKAHEEEKIQRGIEEDKQKKKEVKRLAKEAEEQKKAEEKRLKKLEEDRRLAEDVAIALAAKLQKEEEAELIRVAKALEEEQKRLEEAKLREEETKRIAEEKASEMVKVLDNHVDAGIVVDELENKQECPECHRMITKGGPFTRHYNSHFPNGDGD